MRLHVLLHGYDFAGDGRDARGERRQRDESNRGRRRSFHRSHSARVRSVARRRVRTRSTITIDNYYNYASASSSVTPKSVSMSSQDSSRSGVIRKCHVAILFRMMRCL